MTGVTGPRSTRLGRAVLAGGAVLLVLGLLKGGVWLELLGALLLGARLSASLLDPGRGQPLAVTLDQPRRVTVGDEFVAEVVVANVGSRRLPSATIAIVSPGLSDVLVGLPSLAPGVRVQVEVRRRAVHRGLVDHHEVEVVTADWFAMVQRRRADPLAQPVTIVHPPLVAADWSSRAAGMGAYSADRADRAGLDVLAVREWQVGDQLRHVHWRSTARRGQVMVAARAEPADERFCVLVASASGERLSDALVGRLAGAGLAELHRGRAVTLFAQQAGLPFLDHPQPRDVLDWCAQVAAPTLPDEAQWAAIAQRVPAGHEVLVVTDAPPSTRWWAGAVATVAGYGLSLRWAQ